MSNVTFFAIKSAVIQSLESRWLMLLILITGVALRFAVATHGHNYDFDSYIIVTDILERGGSVYNETARYNYGPVWFNLLSWIKTAVLWFPGIEPHTAFRFGVTGFLALIDVSICCILYKRYSGLTAALYFLNPVSILISGYHSQFDNLALLLGMLSALLLEDGLDAAKYRRNIVALLILGISLATKHLLFLFPLWLAIKCRNRTMKLLCITLPVIVFASGFAPYWTDSRQGIIDHVFRYTSTGQGVFYSLFIPEFFQLVFSDRAVWMAILVISAFVFRKEAPFESLLIYSGILVAASPATSNQYLAIVIPFVSVFPNVFFWLYTAVATVHILCDSQGLGLHMFASYGTVEGLAAYMALILLLCIGLAWMRWREQILDVRRSVYRVIFEQFVSNSIK